MNRMSPNPMLLAPCSLRPAPCSLRSALCSLRQKVSVFFTYPFPCFTVTPCFYSIITSLKFSTKEKFLNCVFLHCECTLTHCFYCNIFSSMILNLVKFSRNSLQIDAHYSQCKSYAYSNHTKIIDKFSTPPSWHNCCNPSCSPICTVQCQNKPITAVL